MRSSHKLSLMTALGIALVLGLYGYSRVRREVALFESDMRRDHNMLGQALAIAASSVASRATPEAAVRLIEDADTDQSNITIRWLPGARAPVANGSGSRELSSVIVADPESDDRWLITYISVTLGELGAGTIELRESLAHEQTYIRATIMRTLLVTLTTIVICSVLIVAFSWMLIGQPMTSIMTLVRRVASGDLTGRLELRQSGEMGELARELDAMCGSLAQAQSEIEQQTRARISALEQLRHANRLSTVGTLASGVAHELGTPLTVIAGRAKMIERGESKGDEVLDDARAIREQSERMTRIIRQLLDFARRKRVDSQPTDLVALTGKTVSLLEPIARKRAVRLEPPQTAEPIVISADPGQIEQVVTNLVINAIHAQPKGGLVKLELSRDDDQVTLVVADQGEGMADEIKAHIFEPFFTTKDVGEGTGLGLSVVYGIVEEHRGRIEVESEPGRGTRFSVILPALIAATD
jgi:signal transduction histidine kinase